MIKINSRGFTFVEMLIVLTIVMIITTAVITVSYKHFQRNEYKNAIEQFRITMHYAQAYAIENKQKINLMIVDNKTLIRYYQFEKRIIELDFPEGMTAQIYTQDRRISFNLNGHIVHPGSIEFITPDTTWKYSVNFSKGRLRLQ